MHRRTVVSVPVTLVTALALVLTACAEDTGGGAGDPTAPEDPVAGTPAGVDPAGRETATPADVTDRGADDEVRIAAEHLAEVALTLTRVIDDHVDLGGDPYSLAVRIRAELDHFLREYVATTAVATAALIDGHEEKATTALDTVGYVTAAMTHIFEVHFTLAEAERFRELWERHTTLYLELAAVVREGGSIEELRGELGTWVDDVTTFVVDLTRLAIPREDLAVALTDHVDTMIALIEAQAEGPPEWLPKWPEAIDPMAHVAELLARTIADIDNLEGEAESEAAKLRAELDGRLLENAYFLAEVTRALLDDQPDVAETARELVRTNTEELTELFSEHLGPEAAARFRELWSRFNELIVALAAAMDEPGGTSVDAIEQELQVWAEEFAAFVVDATNGIASKETILTLVDEYWKLLHDVIEAQQHALETR